MLSRGSQVNQRLDAHEALVRAVRVDQIERVRNDLAHALSEFFANRIGYDSRAEVSEGLHVIERSINASLDLAIPNTIVLKRH